ncbi:COG1361 S-layer family protein [Bifidobacterium colobi]|uniref:COG1361 S-layer family protein n=1 Tax=Bifidobacterium colobi TaxID=2809026 RepID=UPI001F0A5006|nr:ABC transporter permease [Bifidobacterium colobi]
MSAAVVAILTTLAFLAATVFAVLALAFTPASALAVEGDDPSGTGGSAAAPIAGPVPNIIVTNFTYGGDSVAAGSKFDLAFTFQNKGQVAVTNMVVTVDSGESFAIAGGTNTFYVDALWAGYSLTQTVPMQALSSAKSGAQPIGLSFKYEYLDSGARSSTQSDVKISVPISQPDRFEVSNPVLPDQAVSGQETTITMEYVNKGKGDIANVEATMEGDGFDATMKNQYVGNVASGATGSIGYAFTPAAAGELNATMKVTYEDSDGQSKTKEFPVKLTVEDAPVMDDTAVDGMAVEPAGPAVPVWAWIVGAVVLMVLIVVIVVLVRRRRKKKMKSAIDDEWDDWAEGSAKGDAAAADGAGTQSAADAAAQSPATTAAAVPASAALTSSSRDTADTAPTAVLQPFVSDGTSASAAQLGTAQSGTAQSGTAQLGNAQPGTAPSKADQ